MIKVYSDRQRDAIRLVLLQSWNSAALSRMKKLPPLAKFLDLSGKGAAPKDFTKADVAKLRARFEVLAAKGAGAKANG